MKNLKRWCLALSKLSLKFGWNLFSLKASRSPSKIDDIVAVFAGVYDDYGYSWLWSANALRELCLKFGWNLMSWKASRTLSKIDDISRILVGFDDDFDVPDWCWCPWWCFGWFQHVLWDKVITVPLMFSKQFVDHKKCSICYLENTENFRSIRWH